MKKIFKTLALAVVLLFTLTSCSAVHTAISKRNLDVQTKMSDTVWLEPVDASQKVIFLQIKNTTGKDINIEEKVKEAISSKGYTLTTNPAAARYWLQVNVLKVDKVDLREGDREGFAEAMLAGGVGAVLGAGRSGGVYTAAGWGLAGAAITTVADALVKDINYAMVTDILVTEKTGKVVNVATRNAIKQGNSGSRTSTSTEKTDKDKYGTRVLSIANKVNLDFKEALPVLEDELAKVIGGIF